MGSAVGVQKSSPLEQEFSFKEDDIADVNLVKSLSFNSKRDNQGLTLVDEANLKTLKMIKPTTLDVPFVNSSPFGAYRMGDLLSKGKLSTLRLGKHVRDDKSVVIKEIMLTNLNKNEITNLKYDMNVLSQLEHPNVVNLIAVHSPPIRSAHHCSKLFEIQEYLAGQKVIAAVAKQDVLFESDVLKIMTQLFSAVQYLHVRGVVHYCINTDNLMFDIDHASGFAQLKLINFTHCECESIPRRVKRHNPITAFTAPELGPGAIKTVNSKADMYSVGVVMHVLLTGRKPSTFLTLQQSFEYHEFNPVSPFAKNLLMKLLESDPARRYSIEEVMKHPWLSGANVSKSQRPTYSGSQSTMATFTGGVDRSLSADTASPAAGQPGSPGKGVGGLRPLANASTPNGGSRRLSARQSIREEGDENNEEGEEADNDPLNESGEVRGGTVLNDSELMHSGPSGVGDLSNNLYLLREFTLT